jgi:RNA 3'-terminal phosphate cyclase (ATP)
VVITLESEHVTEVFTGFGQRGVRAETVAEGVAREAEEYLEAGVPVGEHLADQLLLPMALAGGGALRSLEPSSHARTQADVIRTFLEIETRFERCSERVWHFEVGPR